MLRNGPDFALSRGDVRFRRIADIGRSWKVGLMESVYLLWHSRADDELGEDAKLIGVYRTMANAEAATARLTSQQGFCDHPQGFEISEYPLDKDHWTEGFVTVASGS